MLLLRSNRRRISLPVLVHNQLLNLLNGHLACLRHQEDGKQDGDDTNARKEEEHLMVARHTQHTVLVSAHNTLWRSHHHIPPLLRPLMHMSSAKSPCAYPSVDAVALDVITE